MAIIDMPLTIRLFFLWCIVTTFTSRIPQFSSIALIIVALAILMHRMILKTSTQDLQVCFKYISISMCVQAFWIFAQLANRDFVMNLPRDVNFVFGTLGNKNLMGALFLMAIVPMYSYKRWTALLPIIGIFYSKASSSIFAVAIGILFCIIVSNFQYPLKYLIRQKVVKFAFLSFLSIAVFFAWHYVDNPFVGLYHGRWPIWKKVLTLMFEKRDVGTAVEEKFGFIEDKMRGALSHLKERRKKINSEFFKRKKQEGKWVDSQIIKAEAAILKLEGIKKDAIIKAEGTDVEFIEKLRNPWLGYGLGTFKFEFSNRLTIEEAGGATLRPDGQVARRSDGTDIPLQWKRAHNTFLQIGREQGLIGMFFLLLIPGMLFAYFLRSPRTEKSIVWMAAVIMICVNAMGNFPDRQFALMFYILFTFAFYRKEVFDEKHNLSVDRVTRFCWRIGSRLQDAGKVPIRKANRIFTRRSHHCI